ncbi:MAG: hypothetical protein ACE5IQ_03040 [Candidatus Methylomirabilales bacterium]
MSLALAAASRPGRWDAMPVVALQLDSMYLGRAPHVRPADTLPRAVLAWHVSRSLAGRARQV